MPEEQRSIADRLFESQRAKGELEEALDVAGVPLEHIGWDDYDCSVEIHGLPPEYRLTVEAQRLIHGAGFQKAYLNHTDKWETHYSFDPKKPFLESKGWRVSYPHTRGEPGGSIWVEDVVSGWPKEWFENGYCVVKVSA